MNYPKPRFVTPPLKSADAEKCANDVAACIEDKAAHIVVIDTFFAAHHGLKNWECQAIGTRALYLAQCKAHGLNPTDLSPLMAKDGH